MKNWITVFEHQTVKLHQKIGDTVFEEPILKALQGLFGEKGVPYFSLVNNGVRFCEYVGVIQVGDIVIEVLPKADKAKSEGHWRDVLIGMLQAVDDFDIQAPSSSDLHLKPNSILDLYFGIFLQEMEYLLHRGLVKRYRRTEGNRNSLKGSIQFAGQIQNNLVHQERFFVRHTVYDVEHTLHQVLYKALLILQQININALLQSRISSLLLRFPEQDLIKVSEATFEGIKLDRKTETYQKAIGVARLLLLNFHPDVSRGKSYVLALMFDMNLLWEQFVYVSLRKGKYAQYENFSVTSQQNKAFWQPERGYRTTIRPDIVLYFTDGRHAVLDTKWKNMHTGNPTVEDLRQMFVYHEYFAAHRVALVYPGESLEIRRGAFAPRSEKDKTERLCSVILVPVEKDVSKWQKQIYKQILDWLSSESNIKVD